MIDELNKALGGYQAKWQALVAGCDDIQFFETLRPTAVAWKATNLADFEVRFSELRDYCDQIHFGWVNDRWLATLHLKDHVLTAGDWNVSIIKLMQRRQGSSDAVGLDHVDFLLPSGSNTRATLEAEDLKWTEENNGDVCKWLSVWFDGTEAKLRSDTVLDVCITELQTVDQQILAGE